jgi:hypothetical protein
LCTVLGVGSVFTTVSFSRSSFDFLTTTLGLNFKEGLLADGFLGEFSDSSRLDMFFGGGEQKKAFEN